MRQRLIILAMMVTWLLAACMPLVQIEWTSSNEEIRISPERSKLAVTILASTPEEAQKLSINPTSSFAISPRGDKYEIEAIRNQYATQWTSENNSPWASFYISLRSNSGGRSIEWENGNWELFIAFDNANRGDIEAKFKLWTFWYIPLIHGPPN